MTKVTVHFINRGYNTDEGYHNCKILAHGICEHTERPEIHIESPFGLGGTLIAKHEKDEWVCDLD